MQEEDFEKTIKVLIVGNGKVGKSSMIRRFCTGTFTNTYKRTIGVDFLEKVHRDLFGRLAETFFQELARTYPDANTGELFWNLHFVVATMLGALAQHRRVTVLSGGACDECDVDGMLHLEQEVVQLRQHLGHSLCALGQARRVAA